MDEPFGPKFYEWWAGASPLLRYGVAVVILIVGLLVWQFDWGVPYFGGALVAAAAILILLAWQFGGE